MPNLFLVCDTNDTRDDGCDHFLLELDKDEVEFLLKLRDGFAAAERASGEALYCIELFHEAGEWGSIAGYEPQSTEDWEYVDVSVSVSSESTELKTVKATSTGVLFSAAWKNDNMGMYFETPELSWKTLEKILTYNMTPDGLFPKAYIAEETDDGEED